MRHTTKQGGLLLALALVGLLAPGAAVEGQARGRANGVPPGHMPPPGECRAWRSGVPPGHQPRPTSCSEARRDAARTGGRVIYGGDERRDERWSDDRWDRQSDRECSAKDRRKGKCERDERYPSSRYPDDRDRPRQGDTPDIWDIILDRR